MKKIILVGYMGSGKSTVGKKIAAALQIPFTDLDTYIEEQEQLTVNEIFKQKGEIYFRKQEHLKLKELLQKKNSMIISLGGGTPCYANNHLFLQDANVLSFYLNTSVTILTERLQHSKNRPLLENIPNLKSYIAQHLFERSYFYNFSQFKINSNNREITEISNDIIAIVKKYI